MHPKYITLGDFDVFQGLTAKTIDSFQGAEQHIMIVDLVIARIRKAKTRFIQDYRRLNVALTRGRDCTIVVGYQACLQDVARRFLDKEAERQAQEGHESQSQEGDDGQPQEGADDVNVPREMKSTLLALFKFYAGTNSVFEVSASQLEENNLAEGIDFTEADDITRFYLTYRICHKGCRLWSWSCYYVRLYN